MKKSIVIPILVTLLVFGLSIVVPFGAANAQTILSPGTWSINANGFKGTLKITSIDDTGRISGTVKFVNEKTDPIDGQYNKSSHILTFTRHLSATTSQFYTGTYDKATQTIKGSFTGPSRYQWTAMLLRPLEGELMSPAGQ